MTVLSRPQTALHLFQAFADVCQKKSSKSALLYKQNQSFQSLSYTQIYSAAIFLKDTLKRSGIRPDDKVTIILDNQPEFVNSFFAIMACGAVAVLMDVQYSAQQIKNLALHSESRALIVSEKIYEKIKDTIHDLIIIRIESPEYKNQFDQKMQSRMEPLPADPNALAILFYTSGTTELPKAVMLSHRNLLSNVDSIQQMNFLTEQDYILSMLPLHHAYAFTVTLLTPLLAGATIVYPGGLTSAELLYCLKATNPTIFVGVPLIFSLLYRSIDAKLKNLPTGKRMLVKTLGDFCDYLRQATQINLGKTIFSEVHKAFGQRLRYLVSGGAKLDLEVARGFTRFGFKILEGYGLTETSPVAAFNPPERPKLGSVGKPLPGVSIKILEPDEKGVGEVLIQGPNVMLGYFHMSQQTAEVLKNGWFHTGDLGHIDSGGYLFLVGRKKEIIILGNGKNIYPEEVERHYSQNPYLKEIGVLANQGTGFAGADLLCAIVVIDEDYFRAQKEANIRDKLKWELDTLSVQLPTYQRISGFLVSQEPLPRTRLGKIMRYKLPEIYRQLEKNSAAVTGQPTLSTHQNLSGIALRAIIFFEETLRRQVKPSDHLELDLGLDSLSRIELLLSLQDRLGLQLSDDEAMGFFMSHTVADLLANLKKFVPEEKTEFKEEKSLFWENALKELPQEETLKKIQLSFNFWETAFNYLVIGFFKIFFSLFFWLRSAGRENLTKEGPYLLCSNHSSFFDALFVLSSLPLKVALNTYFVGSSVFLESKYLKPFVRTARLIPLEMSLNLAEALRACAYVLKNGKIVCYFPEGQRSIDGGIKEFKKGIGILMKEVGVPVVPVYIKGAFKTWGRQQKYPKLAAVKVYYGKKQMPEELLKKDPSHEEIYGRLAKGLQVEVMEMAQDAMDLRRSIKD